MEPLLKIDSPAIVINESNVDTDVIFPARFLLRIDRAGMDSFLFHDRVHTPDGKPTSFSLEPAKAAGARILIAGANFGCGSSREQAVWALRDFGIQCVIAPSFGDIFHGNAARNGLLAIRLPEAEHARIIATAGLDSSIEIDLLKQTILYNDVTTRFDVEPHVKRALVEGLDEIDLLLKDSLTDIEAFEGRHFAQYPWLEGYDAAAAGLSASEGRT